VKISVIGFAALFLIVTTLYIYLLMKEIMQQAICSGYTSISLSVDSKNKYAVHLYKKLRFEECGVDGTSITMIYRNSEEIDL